MPDEQRNVGATEPASGAQRAAAGATLPPVIAPPEEPRTKRHPGPLWAALSVALVAVGIVTLVLAPEPNQGFTTGAAAITLISAAALGIERVIEAFWTVIGQMKRYGDWWPLKQVTDSITDFENQTNNVLSTHLVTADLVLREALNAAQLASDAGDEAEKIERALSQLQPRLDQLTNEVEVARSLAPGSPRLVMLAGTANDAIGTVRSSVAAAGRFAGQAGRDLTNSAEEAARLLDSATGIVSAFRDNPARRLMSLLLGAIVGVAVAGLMGLNLFTAVLDDTSGADEVTNIAQATQAVEDEGACEGIAGCLDNSLGILLTGIIVGFGANPTHEVIRALQRRKAGERRATEVPALARGTATVEDPAVLAFRAFGSNYPTASIPQEWPTRTVRMTD